MKQIIIKTQEEFDKIQRVEKDEEVIFEAEKIRVNCILEVFGVLRLSGEIDCSLRESKYIVAWENSSPSIVARGNSSPSIEARENSSPSIVARGNSSPSIVAWENSSPSIVAWENSSPSIVARGNSSPSIVARENSSPSIVAWENSSPSIVAREGVVRVKTDIVKPIILHGFAVLVAPINLKLTIKKDRNCLVQRIKSQKYLVHEGIEAKKGNVILFKRVSKDYKTQEGTSNETLWQIGSTVTHPCWNPKSSECGEGKFHACSRPYFCDEFRNERDDKYIAVEIATKDLHEWKNPQYPHKIAFRSGKVLYEVDRLGKKIQPPKGGINV